MEENSEMSLDEVLSSIKKMVTDEEPPVLDLTDMISENGKIIKVKKGVMCDRDETDLIEKVCGKNDEVKSDSEMSSFLKLIQENSPKSPSKTRPEKTQVVDCSAVMPHDNRDEHMSKQSVAGSVSEIIKEKNHKDADSNKVLHELISDLLKPALKQWMDENLSRIVTKAVELEIKNLFRQK